MAKVLIFSYPLFGHMNYGLKLGRRLVAEGESVYYYSGERFKSKIEESGVKYVGYNRQIEETFAGTPNSSGRINYLEEIWMLGNHLTAITDHIIVNDLNNISLLCPDYIIYDTLAMWGMKIAELLQIPAIASVTAYSYTDRMMEYDPDSFIRCYLQMEHDKFFENNKKENLYKILNRFTNKLAKQYPVIPNYKITDNFYGHEELNLIYTSREFHLHEHLFDCRTNVFTGPLIDEEEIAEVSSINYKANGKATIYIAMGTIFNNTDFYKTCISALYNLDCNLIISVGETIDISDFGELPDHITLRNHVPQIALLQQCDLFISHGGVNSAREAMYFGVPMLVIPSAGDHFLVAEDVEKQGVGIFLRNVTPDAIRESSLTILMNPQYSDNAKRISDSMREAGGLDTAIRAIFNYKRVKGIV